MTPNDLLDKVRAAPVDVKLSVARALFPKALHPMPALYRLLRGDGALKVTHLAIMENAMGVKTRDAKNTSTPDVPSVTVSGAVVTLEGKLAFVRYKGRELRISADTPLSAVFAHVGKLRQNKNL